MWTMKTRHYYEIQGFNTETHRWDGFGGSENKKQVLKWRDDYTTEKHLGIDRWRVVLVIIDEKKMVVKK